LSIPEGSARVEKFFIDGQDFTQLSDHYGSMVTLEYDGTGQNLSSGTYFKKLEISNANHYHQIQAQYSTYENTISLD